MEPLVSVSPRVSENACPMLNILRAVLFTVVALFLLYLPLGDPLVHCKTIASTHNGRVAMCYICQTYNYAVYATNKAIELLDFVICIILDLLYEAKLKFYALLEKIDRDDLCSAVCCGGKDDELKETRGEISCPLCKCIRKRCRSNSDCRYVKLKL